MMVLQIFLKMQTFRNPWETCVLVNTLLITFASLDLLQHQRCGINILFDGNITSKCHQDKESDLKTAIKKMQQTMEYFKKLKSDTGYEQVLADALEIAYDLEIVKL